MSLFFILFCLAISPLLGYLYVNRRYNYWADRGVPFVKPRFLMGNTAGVGSKIHFGEMTQSCYNELKSQGPIGGIFLYTEPAAVITDMDLLRDVFVKDFQYFRDRGMYVNERDDPLSAHLFALGEPQWKSLRAKLSPTFTSGRMKMMHSSVVSVSEQFGDHLLELSGGKVTGVDLKELLSQFTTDMIGNVAFGVECNTMKDPNNEFRRIGRKMFESGIVSVVKDLVTTLFPNFSRHLRLRTLDAEITEFFFKLLRETVQYRRENTVERNDFLSLLIQIMDTGKLEGDSIDHGRMTFNELAAQTFLFFAAGFETSSATMTFAVYELALNPDIQERARVEIQGAIQRHRGQMTYEAALELRYVDQIIQETLRKYPVVDTHFRKTSADYKVPNTNITLEKGTTVLIPCMGFHHDPEIFPEPQKFDPDRFTKENIVSRHSYAWVPFGKGPRDCVGLRFGMMQSRMGIATILNNFILSPSVRTTIPMKFQAHAEMLSPVGGMFLNLEPLRKAR